MKAKNKLRNDLWVLSSIIGNDKFKLIFVLLVCLSIYGGFVLGIGFTNVIDAMLCTFPYPFFLVFMFGLAFLNVINAVSVFKGYDFYAIRLENKINYTKRIIKIILMATIFFIIIFLLLYVICLNFQLVNNFAVKQYQYYGISNIIYILFYLIKYFIILILLSIIVGLIHHRFSYKGSVPLILIVLSGFYLVEMQSGVVSFQPLLWNYFMLLNYGSFTMEICYSALYILILDLVCYLLYKYITMGRKKS